MSDSSFKVDNQVFAAKLSSGKRNFHFIFVTGVKQSFGQGTTTDSCQVGAEQPTLKAIKCTARVE